jgi:hypothetical protein
MDAGSDLTDRRAGYAFLSLAGHRFVAQQSPQHAGRAAQARLRRPVRGTN